MTPEEIRAKALELAVHAPSWAVRRQSVKGLTELADLFVEYIQGDAPEPIVLAFSSESLPSVEDITHPAEDVWETPLCICGHLASVHTPAAGCLAIHHDNTYCVCGLYLPGESQ